MNKLLARAKTTVTSFLVCVFATAAGTALAVPTLQIDIDGATYVAGDEESVVTTETVFDLYALGTPGGNTSAADLLETIYYLSVAIIPQIGPDPVDFGSFTANGVTYDVGDMTYGTPPLDLYTDSPESGLPPHGIFETYYLQLAFNFDGGNTATTYNVQDDAGTIGDNLGGTGTYYNLFDFDISGLNAGFHLHFDLYDAVVANGKQGDVVDLDAGIFAPFSHDARTNCCDDTTKVPEPGTLGLLGFGLLGLALQRRRARFNP